MLPSELEMFVYVAEPTAILFICTLTGVPSPICGPTAKPPQIT